MRVWAFVFPQIKCCRPSFPNPKNRDWQCSWIHSRKSDYEFSKQSPNSDTSGLDSICHADQPFKQKPLNLAPNPSQYPSSSPLTPPQLTTLIQRCTGDRQDCKGISAKVLTGAMS